MHLETRQDGPRVFVGNDAVVPPGAEIPEGALIGIKSKPPANHLMRAGRHLVRLAADQAAGAAEIRWRRRELDLRAAALEKIRARLLRGGHDFPADHAVHHLRNMGGGMVQHGRARRQICRGRCGSSCLPRLRISLIMTLVVIALKWITMGATSRWSSRCGPGGRCGPRRSPSSIGAWPARSCSIICAARRSCLGSCACSARNSDAAFSWT